MATEVKCPSCGHSFPIEEVMNEEYKLRNQMQQYTLQKEQEYKNKYDEFAAKEQQQQLVFEQRLQQEKKNLQKTLEEGLRRSIATDFENQIALLQKGTDDANE